MSRSWPVAARLAVAVCVSAASVLSTFVTLPVAAAARPCAYRVLIVVAHQDDDLLFTNPDELRDIVAGACVRVVYVTAGDAGMADPAYWQEREAGAKDALAVLAGVPSSWTPSTITTAGGSASVATLASAPRVSAVFLRLPDGGARGEVGLGLTGPTQSLRRIWDNSSLSAATVDGAATYNRASLIATLRDLTAGFRPKFIRTLNPYLYPGQRSWPDHGDHSDHHVSARFAASAARAAGYGARLVAYLGYENLTLAANVTSPELDVVSAAFRAYAAHDGKVCDPAPCVPGADPSGSYIQFLARQYRALSYQPRTAILAYGVGTELLEPGRCLALPGTAGARTGDCGAAQLWTYLPKSGRIRTQGNKCLVARADSSVGLRSCLRARLDGRWLIEEGGGTIRHQAGKCLTAADPFAMSSVTVADCTNGRGQMWGYGMVPPATRQLVFGDRCATIADSASPVGAQLTIADCTGSAGQLWRMTIGGAVVGAGNKCLAAAAGAAGPAVVPCDGSVAQTWTFENGSLVSGGTLCLSVLGGTTDDGSALQTTPCSSSSELQWVLR